MYLPQDSTVRRRSGGAGQEVAVIVRTKTALRRAMQLQSESEHLEFKEAKTDYDFDKFTDYCCALVNEGGKRTARMASHNPCDVTLRRDGIRMPERGSFGNDVKR